MTTLLLSIIVLFDQQDVDQKAIDLEYKEIDVFLFKRDQMEGNVVLTFQQERLPIIKKELTLNVELV